MIKTSHLLFIPLVFLASCAFFEANTQQPKQEKAIPTPEQFIIKSTLTWIAYKTKEKIAVSGTFSDIQLNDFKPNMPILHALEGVSFKIPVDKLSSGNPERDEKILKHFFGHLKLSNEITGVLKKLDTAEKIMEVALTLNDVTKPVFLTYLLSEHQLQLKGKIQLADFSALDALKQLNIVCSDLHKGVDGESHLWDFVDIVVILDLK